MPLHRVGPVPHRLGVRLIAAVGLALLPLAILAYVQASRVQSEAQARSEAALFGETLMAATPLVERINNARGMVAALAAAVPALTDDPDACSALMGRTRAGDPTISFVAYVGADGISRCNSTGETRDFSDSPITQDLLLARKPSIGTNRNPMISGESILLAAHPVLGPEGQPLGFVAVSIPHRMLDDNDPIGTETDGHVAPLSLITFDATGELLSARLGLDSAPDRLPRGRPLAIFASSGAIAFSGETMGGERRTFAVVPMIEGQLFVLASWPPEAATGFVAVDLPLWAFPAAMWFASLLVAWLAAEFQVLRHIRSLRRSIIAFAGGNRAVEPPDLGDAPLELRHVGESYERLVESVLHDEAALEDMVHQREVLLRAVHHRVKNNLQLIASIMNIQMRKAVSPEAKALIKGLHDRVMSLATVHRELYQTSGQADVRADELMQMIVAQVLRMGAQPGREIDVTTDFEPFRLTPDQSVPLSLILTEALTNVLKHGRPDAGGRLRLSVSLRKTEANRAELRIANSAPDAPADMPRPGMESTGMGDQLLQAFTSQLGGTVETSREAGTFKLALTFPLRALAEAEERFLRDEDAEATEA